MADINDDLLNYELGDIDDHDVNIGDEDDLLLSDEENLQNDDEQHPERKVNAEKNSEIVSTSTSTNIKAAATTAAVTTASISADSSSIGAATKSKQSISIQPNTSTRVHVDQEVSTTNKPNKLNRPTLKRNAALSLKVPPKNDEVSSTNKEGDLNRTKPDNSNLEEDKDVISSNIQSRQSTQEQKEEERQQQQQQQQQKQQQDKEKEQHSKPDEPIEKDLPQQTQTEPEKEKIENENGRDESGEVADSSTNNEGTSGGRNNDESKTVIYDESITQSQPLSQESIGEEEPVSSDPIIDYVENSDTENERQNPKTNVERNNVREPTEFNRQHPATRPFFKTRGVPPYPSQRPPTPRFMNPFSNAPFPFPPSSDNERPYPPPQQYRAVPPPHPSHLQSLPAGGQTGYGGPGGPIGPQHLDYRKQIPFNYQSQYSIRPHPVMHGGSMQQSLRPIRGDFAGGTSAGGPNFRPLGPRNGPGGGPPMRFDQSRSRMAPPQQQQQQSFVPGQRQQQPQPPYLRPPLGMQQQQQQQQQRPRSLIPNQTTQPIIVPMKVLINPNFKGGVKAATNQLMMDTMNKSQYSQSIDDELLRKQEAFINQNRIQMERRRYERSSPDRSRDRSYSPPPRRDRRPHSRDRDTTRKPYRGGGGGGAAGGGGMKRRGGSREPNNAAGQYKRQRSSSADRIDERKNSKNEAEDEETRAYRLKIEKQKNMREQILRDKEIRRRRAAEGKKDTEDTNKKTTPEEVSQPPQKLTPIIVTEKKIISLKKKFEHPNSTPKRIVPTAKIIPEAKRTIESTSAAAAATAASTKTTMAVVKPVLKQSLKYEQIDDYDYNEDELLADSPSPSPPPPPPQSSSSSSQKQSSGIIGVGGMFANRRVILKQTTTTTTTSAAAATTATKGPKVVFDSNIDSGGGIDSTQTKQTKGIFDRLDRRVGVTDGAKRKIQRIVIKNTD